MYAHFRKKHACLCNEQGGCPEYGIPNPKKQIYYDPTWFIANGLSDIRPDHFRWFRVKVRNCEHADLKKKRISYKLTNAQNESLSRRLLIKLKERNFLNVGDDAGGHIRLEFNSHVWGQLSLDRKDNELPHFIRNERGEIDDPMQNIGFVILGLNTQANLFSLYGSETCNTLRLKSQEPCSEEQQRAYLHAHTKTWLARGHNHALYDACTNTRRIDKNIMERWTPEDAAVVQSLTTSQLYKYAKELYKAQKGRCDVSDIPLTVKRGPWQASLERINVNRPHIPGNLRLICMCFNCADNTSKKRYVGTCDPQDSCGWTRERFRTYVGIN